MQDKDNEEKYSLYGQPIRSKLNALYLIIRLLKGCTVQDVLSSRWFELYLGQVHCKECSYVKMD